MKKLSQHIAESLQVTESKLTITTGNSSFYVMPNSSTDFDNKFKALAVDVAPDGASSVKLISLGSGTLQMKYDNGDFIIYEKSSVGASMNYRIYGKYNGKSVSSGWVDNDPKGNTYIAQVGARRASSMTDSRLQKMYDEITKFK